MKALELAAKGAGGNVRELDLVQIGLNLRPIIDRRAGVTCGGQMDRLLIPGRLREGRGNRPTGLPGNRSGCPTSALSRGLWERGLGLRMLQGAPGNFLN